MATLKDFGLELTKLQLASQEAAAQKQTTDTAPSSSYSAPQLSNDEIDAYKEKIHAAITHTAFQDGVTAAKNQTLKLLGAGLKVGYDLAGNTEKSQELVDQNKQLEKETALASSSSPFAAAIGSSVPSLVGGAAVGAATGGAGLLVSGLASGAAMGALSPDNINPDLSLNTHNIAKNVGVNAAIGGAVGGLLPLVKKIPLPSQLLGDANAARRAQVLNDAGITKLTPTDISDSASAKFAQATADELPGGRAVLNSVKTAQQEQLPEAMNNYFNKFVTRNAQGDIDGLNSSISDAQKALHAKAVEKYNQLGVATQNLSEKINISPAKNYVNSLVTELGVPPSRITNRIQSILDKTDSNLSFTQLQNLRTKLNNELNAVNKAGDMTGMETSSLSKLKGILDDQTNQWASDIGKPEISKMYGEARGYWAQYKSVFGNNNFKEGVINGASLTDLSNKLLGMSKNLEKLKQTTNFLGDNVQNELVANRINTHMANALGKNNYIDVPKFATNLKNDPVVNGLLKNSPVYNNLNTFTDALQRLKMPKSESGLGDNIGSSASVGLSLLGHPMALLYKVPGYVLGKLITSDPFMKLMGAIKTLPTNVNPEFLTKVAGLTTPYVRTVSKTYQNLHNDNNNEFK